MIPTNLSAMLTVHIRVEDFINILYERERVGNGSGSLPTLAVHSEQTDYWQPYSLPSSSVNVRYVG